MNYEKGLNKKGMKMMSKNKEHGQEIKNEKKKNQEERMRNTNKDETRK